MRKNSPLRVALKFHNRTDIAYEVMLGVLEYKEHVDHWQLVGDGNDPFISLADVNFAELNGIIGFFYEPRWAKDLACAGVSAVNLSTLREDLTLPRIGNDDEATGRLGGVHFLERGFTNFGFIGFTDAWFSGRRLAGFRRVVDQGPEREIHVLDSLVQAVPVNPALIRDWLKDLPKPLGIMASNDNLGRDVIAAAEDMGFRVPDDIAVLGVDNNKWAMALANKPLSSVAMNVRHIGYHAAEMLDSLMAGHPPPPPRWIPPVGVVTRRSTDVMVAADPVAGRALNFIRDHCGECITVEDVWRQVGVSRRTLETRLKRLTGQTPQGAIRRARIERAKKLLLTTGDPIKQVAAFCGFSREDRFFIIFKRLTGMTPGQYRKRFGRMMDR